VRLTILGATGPTGRLLTDRALAAGHEVTALVRDPARLPIAHDRLRVVTGDVLDPGAVAEAVTGSEAVLSALGTRERGPTTVYSAGTANVVKAMHAAGVRRLVAVTAAPVAEPGPDDTLPYRVLVRPLLRRSWPELYADMARMEAELPGSGLDWTVLRPPRLTGGAARGRYRTAVGTTVRRGYFLRRADLAGAMLAVLDDRATFGAAVGIGN
jgi:putative NADH-flavin reductase